MVRNGAVAVLEPLGNLDAGPSALIDAVNLDAMLARVGLEAHVANLDTRDDVASIKGNTRHLFLKKNPSGPQQFPRFWFFSPVFVCLQKWRERPCAI